jgi:hypothetical protein
LSRKSCSRPRSRRRASPPRPHGGQGGECLLVFSCGSSGSVPPWRGLCSGSLAVGSSGIRIGYRNGWLGWGATTAATFWLRSRVQRVCELRLPDDGRARAASVVPQRRTPRSEWPVRRTRCTS